MTRRLAKALASVEGRSSVDTDIKRSEKSRRRKKKFR